MKPVPCATIGSAAGQELVIGCLGLLYWCLWLSRICFDRVAGYKDRFGYLFIYLFSSFFFVEAYL